MADYRKVWDAMVMKRNLKLEASDWTQMADSPLTDSKKAEWATYRQTLRNIPNTLRSHSNYVDDTNSHPDDGSIVAWAWPTKPS